MLSRKRCEQGVRGFYRQYSSWLAIHFIVVSRVTLAFDGPGFVVTSNDDMDDGTCDTAHCSLRGAINEANQNADTNTVTFNIPGAGVHTIQPTSPLPGLDNPVIIDGTTQPGYSGSPLIELDGTYAGANANGFFVRVGNTTIRGLIINRFSLDRIQVGVNGTITVQGN